MPSLSPTVPTLLPPGTGPILLVLILIAGLVAVLLGVGFVAVNVALLSRRKQDRAVSSNRDSPGELNLLKNTLWPEEAADEPSAQELEERASSAILASMVGAIGSKLKGAVESIEGGVSGTEAREAGGIGSAERSPSSEQESRPPSKKVS